MKQSLDSDHENRVPKNSVLDGVWGTWFTAPGQLGAVMRGTDETTGALFSYVDLEERIPPRHPLRKVRAIVNDALASSHEEAFFSTLLEGWYTAPTPRS